MKTKIKALLLLLPLLVFGMVSCGDDDNDPKPITFLISENSKNVPVNADGYIKIESGNQNYSFTVADKSILSVEYVEATEYHRFGGIKLLGLKEGVTTLTVKDNVAKTTKDIEIHITPRYLLLRMSNMITSVVNAGSEEDLNSASGIAKDIFENSFLKTEYYVALMGNVVPSKKNDKMYIFKSYEEADKGNVLYRGTYGIEKNEDIYTISLNVEENGKTVTHQFTMRDSSTSTFDKAVDFLSGSTKDGIIHEFNVQSVFLTEDLLDVYKPKYPLLSQASYMIETYLFADELDLTDVINKDK